MNFDESSTFEQSIRYEDGQKSNETQQMACVPIISMTDVSFDIDLAQKYTLSKAKEYAHSRKLTDPASLKKIAKMKAYFNDQIKKKPFAPPTDEMLLTFNHCFNKLTPDLKMIHSVAEKIIHSNFFGTELFFSPFAKYLVDTAVNQTAFAPVYVRFLQEVYCGLPTAEQKQILYKELDAIIFKDQHAKLSLSFLIGCLVSADLLDSNKVMELIKTTMKQKTTEAYECVCNILLFGGKKMDECCENFEDDVIDILTAAIGNTDIKQRIRFLISDILEGRSNDWDVGPIIQNIAILPRDQALAEEKKRKEREERKVDDVYDKSILTEYISSGSLPNKLNRKTLLHVMLALEMSSFSEYEKGIRIFSEFNDINGDKLKNKCIDCLNESRKIVDTPENIQEFPYCVKTVGAIFSQLVILKVVDPCIFGTEKFPFHVNVLSGMIDEFDRTDNIDVFLKNEYLSDFKFRPATYPYSFIVNELNIMGLDTIFPLYQSMFQLFDMIASEESPEDVDKFINKDLDKKIVKSTAFIEYVTELIIIQGPARYQCLIELISHRPMEALLHVECIGKFFQWKPEQIAAKIRNLSRFIKAELSSFKMIDSSSFHKIVCRFIE